MSVFKHYVNLRTKTIFLYISKLLPHVKKSFFQIGNSTILVREVAKKMWSLKLEGVGGKATKRKSLFYGFPEMKVILCFDLK